MEHWQCTGWRSCNYDVSRVSICPVFNIIWGGTLLVVSDKCNHCLKCFTLQNLLLKISSQMTELSLAKAWALGEAGLGICIGCQAIWKSKTNRYTVVRVIKLRVSSVVTCDGVPVNKAELVLLPPRLVCSKEKSSVKKGLDVKTIEKDEAISIERLGKKMTKTNQADKDCVFEPAAKIASGNSPLPSAISPVLPLHPGSSIDMLVVSADSPSHIIVRLLNKEGEYQRMLADLASGHFSPPWVLQKKPVAPPSLSVGSTVAAMIQGKGWLRAEVVAPVSADLKVEDIRVNLFLCDVGESVSLPVASLRSLPDCYCQLPRLAYLLHLDDLVPAGGKEWSKSAKEMLASTLLQQEVEVEVLGPPNTVIAPQLPSHPASICLVQRYASDPVAPSVTVKTDVATRYNIFN